MAVGSRGSCGRRFAAPGSICNVSTIIHRPAAATAVAGWVFAVLVNTSWGQGWLVTIQNHKSQRGGPPYVRL